MMTIPLTFYKNKAFIPLTFYIFMVKSCVNDENGGRMGAEKIFKSSRAPRPILLSILPLYAMSNLLH